MFKNLLVALCLALLVAPYASAEPRPSETTDAQQLVRASGRLDREFQLLHGPRDRETGALILEALTEDDPTLRDDLEEEFVRYFDRTLEPEQMTALAEWFESSPGQSYRAALHAALGIRDVQIEPPSGVSPDDPRRQLAERLKVPWDTVEALAEALDEEQLPQVLEFFDSPLGQDWLEVLGKLPREIYTSSVEGSPVRRMSILGCTLGIAQPRVEQYLASLDPTTPRTTEDLAPILSGLLQVKGICDCLITKLAERAGPESLYELQLGDSAASEQFAQVVASGVCLPENLAHQRPKGQLLAAVRGMRNLGTAMMNWLTDSLSGLPPGSDSRSPIPLAGGGWSVVPQGGGEPAYFAKVSAEELEKALVPKYLEVLPRFDSWGHPLEYAVNTNLLANATLSLRSTGSDGVFETGAYETGPYPADDFAQDLVWADGYFVRWPEGE